MENPAQNPATSKTKTFKIIFPYWHWEGTSEDHDRLRKLEDECCESGLCTREELDNWKELSLQMLPGFIKNVIVPSLVQQYLKERELKKAETQIQARHETKSRYTSPKGRKSKVSNPTE